jgi:hypothetical protein
VLTVGTNRPGVFIGVLPEDIYYDTAGFAGFARLYSPRTVVTLVAPQVYGQSWFVGWRLSDTDRMASINGVLMPGRIINLVVLQRGLSVEAVYMTVRRVRQ